MKSLYLMLMSNQVHLNKKQGLKIQVISTAELNSSSQHVSISGCRVTKVLPLHFYTLSTCLTLSQDVVAQNIQM